MAVDMYLKLGPIKGESQDKSHKDEIDVLAWSWGASQSGTTHMGKGSGAGKANFQDLSITKYVDSATTDLFKFCSKGTHIEQATLVVRKAGDGQMEYIVLDIADVIISSISTGGSGGEDRLTENVSLNFGAYYIQYVPQTEAGAPDTITEWKWDIAQNSEAFDGSAHTPAGPQA
jgi:type VI secretion system secreted protein Hcp